MNWETPFAARITFGLLPSLNDLLNVWADEEDHPLANITDTLIKHVVTEHERDIERVSVANSKGNTAISFPNLVLTDLRETAEENDGMLFASNSETSLWRCPFCPSRAFSLLMVSEDDFCCLRRNLHNVKACKLVTLISAPFSEVIGLEARK